MNLDMVSCRGKEDYRKAVVAVPLPRNSFVEKEIIAILDPSVNDNRISHPTGILLNKIGMYSGWLGLMLLEVPSETVKANLDRCSERSKPILLGTSIFQAEKISVSGTVGNIIIRFLLKVIVKGIN